LLTNPGGYLLNTVFVTVLESDNFIGALAGVLNLFPGFHFLLLEQGNAVGEKLCIALNSSQYRLLNMAITYSLRRFLVSASVAD
jgi:hypothetical protein